MTAALVIAVGASWAEPGSVVVRELSAALGVEVEGRGHRGRSLLGWAQRTPVPPRGTLVYVLEMGGNTSDVEVSDIRREHTRLSSSGATVLWIPPPGWPANSDLREGVAARRARMARAIRLSGVPTLAHGWRATGDDLANYAHLNRDGARRFAAAIARARRPSSRWKALAASAAAILLGRRVFR